MPQYASRLSLILAPCIDLLAAALAAQRLVARVIDGNNNAVDVGRRLIADEEACEFTVRNELAFFEQSPYFLRVVRAQKLGRILAESAANIVDVTLEQRSCAVVAGCVYSLRQIDDDRAVAADKHVVLRKIAVNDAHT